MPEKKTPRKSGLGKGLDALLKDNAFVTKPTPALSLTQEIPIAQIEVNPFQPRQDFDKTALQELSESIRLHGIIQPISVRKLDAQRYQLIAGERRLKAAQLAGLQQVVAYIRTANDQQMLEMGLVENIQRENLNPIEIAFSYQRLLTECNIQQEALGQRVGKNRTTVNNYLRLLKLPPDVQIALRDRDITMGHARALVNVPTLAVQLKLLQKIITEGLSVRQVEALVRNTAPARSKKTVNASNVALQEASERLSRHLNTKIKVHSNAKGEIKLTFVSITNLDRILQLFE